MKLENIAKNLPALPFFSETEQKEEKIDALNISWQI